MKKKIEEIAKKYLRIDSLETRMSDSLDFHDCSVWNIKAALEAAYNAGSNKGYVEATNKEFPDFSSMCITHGFYPCKSCHPKEYKAYRDAICYKCGFSHPGESCMDS